MFADLMKSDKQITLEQISKELMNTEEEKDGNLRIFLGWLNNFSEFRAKDCIDTISQLEVSGWLDSCNMYDLKHIIQQMKIYLICLQKEKELKTQKEVVWQQED